MPKAKSKSKFVPKSGIWVTETGPDGRERHRQVEGGLALCKDSNGKLFWKELPPQPIRVLPPRTEEGQPKTPKRKAG